MRGKSKCLALLLLGVLLMPNDQIILARPGPCEKQSSCKMLRSMARVKMAFGDYSKAQPLVEQALTLARTDDACDAELCLCLIDAAWLYKHQYKLSKAERMCLSGLELQEKINGEDHQHVAYTLRILSSIYKEQSRYRQAVSVLSRAMAIMQEHHSPGDAALAGFEVDFGGLMEATGDFAQAEAYYSRALPVINESYGPEHLYTAQVLGKIAGLYMAQGRCAQAESLISRTLTIQEKIYGTDHHLMAPTWLTMARIYLAEQDYAQAERLLQKALSVLEKNQGPEHRLTGKALTTIGQLYVAQGRQAEGEVTLQRAINVLNNSAGPESDCTAMALNNLARLYVLQGKYSQAQELCLKALKALEPVFDKEHPSISEVRDTIDQLNRKSPGTMKLAQLE